MQRVLNVPPYGYGRAGRQSGNAALVLVGVVGVIAVIAAAVALSVGFGSSAGRAQPPSEDHSVPSAAASPIPSPSIEPVVTKTYTSTRFRYSIEYPANWSPTVSTSSPNEELPWEQVVWHSSDRSNRAPVLTIWVNFQGGVCETLPQQPPCATRKVNVGGVAGTRFASPHEPDASYGVAYILALPGQRNMAVFTNSTDEKWVYTLDLSF